MIYNNNAIFQVGILDDAVTITKGSFMVFSENITIEVHQYHLKIIIDANQAKFGLFERGPNITNIKALEERLNKVES